MNTMYRNNETEYKQVKDMIADPGNGILSSTDIVNIDERRNYLTDRLKDRRKLNWEAAEKNLQDALCNSTSATSDTTWSQEMSYEISKNFAYLKDAPKALLHVHSKVGLSVEGLKKLILYWNSTPNFNKGYLRIYHAKVITADGEEIDNVLLYERQTTHPDDGWTVSEPKPVDEDWLDSNMSFFYLSGQADIEVSWKKFTDVFSRTDHLFKDQDFYELYHQWFFEECLNDNIRYVELRTGFEGFTDWNKQEEIGKGIVFLRPGFRMEDYLYHADLLSNPNPLAPDTTFLDKILSAKDNAMKGKACKPIKVKVILTANRNKEISDENNDKDETRNKVDTAITIKNRIGQRGAEIPEEIADMIVGFDFVNMEKDSSGLTDQFCKIMYEKFPYGDSESQPKLNQLKDKSRMQLIRFFLHDGESTKDIRDNRSNAVTGPICTRHRIGHGFQMGTDANLKPDNQLYGKDIMHYILNGHRDDVGRLNYPVFNSIAGIIRRDDYITEPVIELCPISNYMLGYVKELHMHPAISLMEEGILAVICNDDPQIFHSCGLSHDYAVMYIALKKHFEIQDENRPIEQRKPIDERQAIAHAKAYEYLKISFFLGYFYQEMSNAYYISVGKGDEAVKMVNDNLAVNDERLIFENAADKFIVDWGEFINQFEKKTGIAQGDE